MRANSPRAFICVLTLVSSSCTTTHVQWDAVQMRKHVIDYYNDEIMDNLIRGSKGELFVHVDITGLSALAGSKLSASVGSGESVARTHGPTVVAGAIVNTITRVVTTPFTASVTPERTNNLTIASTPVIGKGTGDEQQNIYTLYLSFLNLTKSNKDKDLSQWPSDYSYLHRDCCSVKSVCTSEARSLLRSGDGYVPGTLRSRGDCLYYIPKEYHVAYLKLCKALLTRERPKPPTVLQAPAVLIN